MKKLIWGLLFVLVAALFFFWTNFGVLDPNIEVKGASELTEWVKLAIAVVSLLIGIVNLRIALAKEKKSDP